MGLLGGQLVQHAFTGGLDDKTDPRHVEQTRFIDVSNGRFTKAGKLSKRPGIEALATTADGVAMADSYGVLAPAGNELCYLNGSTISSYSPARGTFVARGKVPSVGVSSLPVFATSDNRDIASAVNGTVDGAYGVDVADSSNLRCFVWSTKQTSTLGKIECYIVDKQTGAVVFEQQLETTENYYAPRVCCVGADFFVCYVNSGSAIVCRKIAVSTTITVTSLTLGLANRAYQLECVALADRVAVISGDRVGLFLPRITVSTVNTSLALIASATVAEALGATWGFSIDGSIADNTCVLSWVVQDGINYRVRYAAVNATTLATTLAPTTIYSSSTGYLMYQTSVARSTATTYYIGFSGKDYTTSQQYITMLCSATTAGVVSTANNRRTAWTHLASDVFVMDGRVYSWLCAGGATGISGWGAPGAPTKFFSHCLVDWRMDETTVSARVPRVIGTVHPRTARRASNSGSTQHQEQFSSVVGTYSAALVSKIGAEEVYGVDMVAADFAATSRYQSARFGDVTYFSGGTPFAYDGVQPYECGFAYDIQGPFVAPVSLNHASGNMVPAEVYFYSFCYAWTDATGQIMRGAPSSLIEATVGGGHDAIQLELPCLSLTQLQRPTNVWIEIYRTTNGGATALYLDRIKNNELAPTVTYTDIYQSDAVASRAQLYTNGGAVPNVAPPALSSLLAHKGRLFGIGPDARTVWFSSQYITGQFPAFHDEFTLPFDFGSDLTALGSLDAALVMFSSDRIWYLPGDGPLNTLARNDYGIPTPIACDVGCINPRSVVQTPLGLFFQSRVGIYLLTRGLEVQFIGQPVENRLNAYTTIISATVHPTDHCVYFETNQGRLVYDYRSEQWLRDSHVAHANPLHGCAWGGVYHFTSGAGVYRETKASYLSLGAFVGITFKLGWAKPAGLQGWANTLKLSLMISPITAARVQIATFEDYESATASQTKVYTTSEIIDMRGSEIKQLELSQKTTRVASKTIEVSELAPETGYSIGTGQGIGFVGLTYEVAQAQGGTRLPAANKR